MPKLEPYRNGSFSPRSLTTLSVASFIAPVTDGALVKGRWPQKTCQSVTSYNTNPTWTSLGWNQSLSGEGRSNCSKKPDQPRICHFNPALRAASFCENEFDFSNQKTKAQSRVMVELIRTDGLQALYTLAHWSFTFSRHIRNFKKSASASFFCSFYPTVNKIKAYVRLIPYYKLSKFA
jgi:hypothetical protein